MKMATSLGTTEQVLAAVSDAESHAQSDYLVQRQPVSGEQATPAGPGTSIHKAATKPAQTHREMGSSVIG